MPDYHGDYTGAQIDEAIGRILGSGIGAGEIKNSIAFAQAMTKAEMASARVVIIIGGLDAYDGLGGGVYHYDSAGTDADDGIAVLRPVNFSGSGVLRKII